MKANEIIKEFRKGTGLSQEQLGRLVHVSGDAISSMNQISVQSLLNCLRVY